MFLWYFCFDELLKPEIELGDGDPLKSMAFPNAGLLSRDKFDTSSGAYYLFNHFLSVVMRHDYEFSLMSRGTKVVCGYALKLYRMHPKTPSWAINNLSKQVRQPEVLFRISDVPIFLALSSLCVTWRYERKLVSRVIVCRLRVSLEERAPPEKNGVGDARPLLTVRESLTLTYFKVFSLYLLLLIIRWLEAAAEGNTTIIPAPEEKRTAGRAEEPWHWLRRKVSIVETARRIANGGNLTREYGNKVRKPPPPE